MVGRIYRPIYAKKLNPKLPGPAMVGRNYPGYFQHLCEGWVSLPRGRHLPGNGRA